LRAICNTSPLILLAKIHRLDLLVQLYEEVVIPASVLDEVKAKPGKEAGQVQALLQNRKCLIRKAAKRAMAGTPSDLGAGEREVVTLALEAKTALVVLDDQQGRCVARERGLSITGTVGVLIEARGRGLIPSVRRELDRLIEAGMWMDEVFYHRILQQLGE